MNRDVDRKAFVPSWLEEQARGPLGPAEAVGRGWAALWGRAEVSLGPVTVGALAQRALAQALERYPELGGLGLEAGAALPRAALDRGQETPRLREALAFLLADFFALLGRASGDILLPALEAALRGGPGRLRAGAPGRRSALPVLKTGVPNLDLVLGGGLPRGSTTVLAGPPGSGKTILAQQICFHAASSEAAVLYFSTLSEPSSKLLLYLKQLDYFDPAKLEGKIQFIDLGRFLRAGALDAALPPIIEPLKGRGAGLIVIDSFRMFETLARSPEELQRFIYVLAAQLAAWDCTTLLLGEYAPQDFDRSPLSSIVDGLIQLSRREAAGEDQRLLQVVKLRGAAHDPDPHIFEVTQRGVEVHAPRLTIRRRASPPRGGRRLRLGISKIDVLLGGGVRRGSSVLLGGVSGTGKTVLMLEFLYRGALAGEKGLYFSFEEHPVRLLQTAKGFGWDLEVQVERGLIDLIFVPQPEVRVAAHLEMIQERVKAFKPDRVAVDSLSVFLHKIPDLKTARESAFQLALIVEQADAVGLLASDIPHGSGQLSRTGVEETVLDGLILLSSEGEGLDRRRFIEVFKLRGTPHLMGRHALAIGDKGLSIFPRYSADPRFLDAPPALELSRREKTGVPGLDALLGGGVLDRSATIVSGSAGVGKSTLALQFISAGARAGQRGIYVTLEEGPAQILASAGGLGLPLADQVKKGLVKLLYFSPERLKEAQFLTILTDQLQAHGARRVVVDSTSHLIAAGVKREEALRLLYNLVVRFKTLGVTSLLTVESSSMAVPELLSDYGVSPVADNLLVLRYAHHDSNRSLLTVVKTRGSPHAVRTHVLTIGKGGMRIGRPTKP